MVVFFFVLILIQSLRLTPKQKKNANINTTNSALQPELPSFEQKITCMPRAIYRLHVEVGARRELVDLKCRLISRTRGINFALCGIKSSILDLAI